MELISEPFGSNVLSERSSVPTPIVGMSLEKMKSSHPKPKILDTRLYSYYEMIEDQARQYDSSDEFEVNISPEETNF